tara:strand:- start:1032 stop:1634 length:603 start_codon:yes stop_codon:yes gene_type:complete
MFIFNKNCHILFFVSNQNLIIYKFNELYQILEELSLDLNFIITYVDNEDSLNGQLENLNNYLIISNKKYLNFGNQFILDNLPINIFKLVEKINIEFLKLQFNSQSEVKVNNYTINLNSREMLKKNTKLKLTEKEINTIIYLSKSDKPVSVDELQKKVWSYQTDIETHTVETHIYRLRKKILNKFNDNDFIISEKNGYQIK